MSVDFLFATVLIGLFITFGISNLVIFWRDLLTRRLTYFTMVTMVLSILCYSGWYVQNAFWGYPTHTGLPPKYQMLSVSEEKDGFYVVLRTANAPIPRLYFYPREDEKKGEQGMNRVMRDASAMLKMGIDVNIDTTKDKKVISSYTKRKK